MVGLVGDLRNVDGHNAVSVGNGLGLDVRSRDLGTAEEFRTITSTSSEGCQRSVGTKNVSVTVVSVAFVPFAAVVAVGSHGQTQEGDDGDDSSGDFHGWEVCLLWSGSCALRAEGNWEVWDGDGRLSTPSFIRF